MTRLAPALLLAFGLAGAAWAGNDDVDMDKVNGSIHVPDNATVGKVSTVNGSIKVGANAHAKSAETVNGGIDLDSGATVDSLETVNGGIHSDFAMPMDGNKRPKKVDLNVGSGGPLIHIATENGGVTVTKLAAQ